MSKELEALEKLLSFAFVMSENMVGLTKGNYDEDAFIKKTYAYLHKYNVDLDSKLKLKEALQHLEQIENANPSEALKCLDKIYNTINLNWNNDLLRVGIDVRNRSDCYDEKEMTKCLDTIKQALLELQSIKESNPSEALKAFEDFKDISLEGFVLITPDLQRLSTIKQALLKSQEQEKEIDRLEDQCLDFLGDKYILKKILRIVFEKQVDFEVFGAFETYKDYEIYYNKKFHIIDHKLTEEEFKLIQEMKRR